MPARVVDTIATFDTFAKNAALEIPVRREMLWTERYESAHPDVFEAFYAAQGPPEGRPAMLRELSRVRQRVAEAAPIMRAHVEEVDPRLAEVLGRPSEPSPVHVLMVGAFSTNAVVGRLGDDVAVFHCLEWFQSAEGAKVLVAHEGAHAWQELAMIAGGAGAAERPPEDDLAWLAFTEGFAIAASREVVPDQAEDDYFWYGHPETEGWLRWCRERRDQLVDLFRSSLDDPKAGAGTGGASNAGAGTGGAGSGGAGTGGASNAVETFFGAGFVEGKWRTGYFVADELVRGLGLSLPELAATSVADGKAAIRAALAAE